MATRAGRVTTTLAVYGHLFPGVDERLDGLLEAVRAGGARDGRAKNAS